MTKYIATINEHEYLVEIIDDLHVSVDGIVYDVDFLSISDQPVYSILVNGSSYEGYVVPEEQLLQVLLRGTLYPILVEDEREKRLRAHSRRQCRPDWRHSGKVSHARIGDWGGSDRRTAGRKRGYPGYP